MKLTATSDLHLGHTDAAKIKSMAQKIRHQEKPDLFLVLGDAADGRRNFFDCLQILAGLGTHRIVVPGNHDLYDYHRDGSEYLYRQELPRLANTTGFLYGNRMEVIGDVTIITTPGWCSGKFNSNGFDQKAIDDSYYSYMSDGRMVNMSILDLHQEQLAWFTSAIKVAATKKLVVGSHYPLFAELYEPYIQPRPSDAFFYSPEFGEVIKAHSHNFDSVTTFAGHVHRGGHKKIGNIECFVIPSGYHNPNFITIEV